MAFWALEVIPGKDFATQPPFDLHLTQVVLPANATDNGRTVLQAKVDDKQFAIASLKLDRQENIALDLIFEAGKQIHFSVTGKNPVQLLGYFIDNQGFSDDDDEVGNFDVDEDEDEEVDDELDGEKRARQLAQFARLASAEDDEDDDDDEDDEEGDEDEDEEDADEDQISQAVLQHTQKRKPEQHDGNGAAKKAKVEGQKPQQQKPQQQQPQKGQQKQQQPQQQQPKGEQKKGEQKGDQKKGEQKPQQQQQQKPQTPGKEQPKGEQKTPQPKGEQQQQRPQTPGNQQKTEQKTPVQKGELKEGKTRMVNGVKIETMTIGLGGIAETGKKVSVMYTGKLENGKVFDKSKAPFSFRLGAEEVIKGWDIGVKGMRVGEKRRLTIPSGLGYGRPGAPPDIPPNATLIFDVELIKI